MVVFKRQSKLATTTSIRKPEPVDTERARNVTIRYSDIAAGRRNTHALSTTPIQRLLDTFELCEQVLGYLPMKDVLHFTRVCRAFKDNIEGSSLLQAKLFLAPDRTLKKLAVSPKGTLLASHRAEQQIAAATPANEGADIANSGHQVETGEISLYNPHPYLRTDRLSDRYKRMGVVRYAKVCLESRHSEMRSGTSIRNFSTAMTVPADSSFYRMLISQPPAGEVTIRLPFRSDHRSQIFSLRSMKVRNKSGVTMGDILHTIHHAKDLDNIPPYMKCVDIFFPRGFAANERARRMVEEAGELSTQDDLTRWLLKDDCYVLKEGGFEFW